MKKKTHQTLSLSPNSTLTPHVHLHSTRSTPPVHLQPRGSRPVARPPASIQDLAPVRQALPPPAKHRRGGVQQQNHQRNNSWRQHSRKDHQG